MLDIKVLTLSFVVLGFLLIGIPQFATQSSSNENSSSDPDNDSYNEQESEEYTYNKNDSNEGGKYADDSGYNTSDFEDDSNAEYAKTGPIVDSHESLRFDTFKGLDGSDTTYSGNNSFDGSFGDMNAYISNSLDGYN